MNDLRYFLAVALEGNVNRAGQKLAISPGSLSKAISRLEEELSVALFKREGRNIRITDHGKLLQKRASEIMNLEQETRHEIGGTEQQVKGVICGEELLLGEYAVPLVQRARELFPNSNFTLEACSTDEALKKIEYGEAHLAFTTKSNSDLHSKIVDRVKFKICVGKNHSLYSRAKKSIPVDIKEALELLFVSPSQAILGKVQSNQSFDGWRDDKYPRRNRLLVSHASLLFRFVEDGKVIAYLPDYIVKKLDVLILTVEGCPYTCEQNVYAVSKKAREIGWLNQVL